jgi:hypothetical protein
MAPVGSATTPEMGGAGKAAEGALVLEGFAAKTEDDAKSRIRARGRIMRISKAKLA